MQLVCLWPGMAAAWHRGFRFDLAVAIASCWFASLLLLATFVWPAWLPIWLVRTLWLAAVVGWLANAIYSHLRLPKLLQTTDSTLDEDFQAAQTTYLRGEWFEAEAQLLEIIEKAPRDAEAWLLLVGVLRHTGRIAAAQRKLKQLQQLDGAAQWAFEIRREQELIAARQQAKVDSDSDGESASSESSGEGDCVGEEAVCHGVEAADEPVAQTHQGELPARSEAA